MKFIIILLCFTLMSTLGAKSTLQELTETQSFLTELLVRVQTETILNHTANQRIITCLHPKIKSEECTIARTQVFQSFPEVVGQARIHLAMGYRDGIFGGSFTKVNSRLSNLGTYKDVGWSALSPIEQRATEDLMKSYIQESQAEASKNPKVNGNTVKTKRFVDLLVRKKRLVHLQLYKDLLSQIILLQYVQDERVNQRVLSDALNRMMDRSNKEIATMNKMARSLEIWIKQKKDCAETVDYQLNNPSADGVFAMATCVQTPAILLGLLDYRSFVDGVLVDYPQFGRVVKNLQSERTARSILIGTLITVPTLALSVFAPPMVAIPAGALGGAIALWRDQDSYNKIRRRELSRIVNPSGDVDWDALKNGRFARNMSAVMLPFFGAGKYISPYLKNAASPAAKYVAGMMKLKYLKVVPR